MSDDDREILVREHLRRLPRDGDLLLQINLADAVKLLMKICQERNRENLANLLFNIAMMTSKNAITLGICGGLAESGVAHLVHTPEKVQQQLGVNADWINSVCLHHIEKLRQTKG